MPFDLTPQTETEQQRRTRVGRIALEAIARKLDSLPRNLLDMDKWCGTKQCAIGHGMSLPEVRATGLQMLVIPEYADLGQQAWPVFEGKNSDEAIAAAFGIPEEVAFDLFICTNGNEPESVAAAIRDYLEDED